jgi:ribosomal protein S18 acetylase RimI-like enzyme
MISDDQTITIRPVAEQDRQRLANLIHFEALVHRHLDWRPALDWIGYQPYLLAERNNSLLASLACPPDPPNVAWIHLFAVSSKISSSQAWDRLWPSARSRLIKETQANTVAVIPLQRWFRTLIERSDFVLSYHVVVLACEYGQIPPERKPNGIKIRSMSEADLNTVEEIDGSAFSPIWRNSYDSLSLAYQQSAVATVAEISGRLVGYQISTATPMGGHLARLAVRPDMQGQGIGYSIVRDLLNQFWMRGAHSVTVNTQNDNTSSLSLYKRAGFETTGEEYPVYQQGIRD